MHEGVSFIIQFSLPFNNVSESYMCIRNILLKCTGLYFSSFLNTCIYNVHMYICTCSIKTTCTCTVYAVTIQ